MITVITWYFIFTLSAVMLGLIILKICDVILTGILTLIKSML